MHPLSSVSFFVSILSEITGPVDVELGRNVHWMVLCKVCVFLQLKIHDKKNRSPEKCFLYVNWSIYFTTKFDDF